MSSNDTPAPLRASSSWYQELVIRFKDRVRTRFFIERTRSGTHRPQAVVEPAAWTRLEHHRCPGCPLAEAARWCPAALSLEQTLDKLAGRISYEVVEATAVDGMKRTFQVRWPLQEVGAIFVQLAVFASGCPLGGRFKAFLADLPPFATSRELGRHLVSRLLLAHRGSVEECREELDRALTTLRTVLAHLRRRLAEGRALAGDAVPNAIVAVDAFAGCLAFQADALLGELGGRAAEPAARLTRWFGRLFSFISFL